MRQVLVSLMLAACSGAIAQELPPLEAYGALPESDLLTLSPSGRYAALRSTQPNEDRIVVLDSATKKTVAFVDASEINPRELVFVAEDRLVLVAGETVRARGVRKPFDANEVYVLDVPSGETRRLMDNVDELYAHQSGLGEIIGYDRDSRAMVMPAYVDSPGKPPLGIFSVPLYATREELVARGSVRTRDWLVDRHGVPIAREDFNDRDDIFQIWTTDARGRQDRLLYEEYSETPPPGFVGVTADYSSLVVRLVDPETDASSLFLMSVEDGSVDGPILSGEGLEVRRIIADTSRVVYGVEFDGFEPSYSFFDEELDVRVKTMQRRLQDTYSRLVAWSADFGKLVFRVEGGWSSGAYMAFESATSEPQLLALARPLIDAAHVATVRMIEYTARDGLKIPALLTSRQDVRAAGPAPTIVMPHGGPRSHDEAGFDWMAQYFASRGYVVLQPQFRGSDGLGQALEEAGKGQWGSGMQHDIDDGVRFLVRERVADPDRVCIVGWSYGGYAALWAGAFSAELYRCVAAIAPVTDLSRKLRDERRATGRDWVVDYWESLCGAEASEEARLRAISPAYHADRFEAPVLIVHGRKDTVVRFDQSEVMSRALGKAGKDVTFVPLESGDHWMSSRDTRIDTLQHLATFIDAHL